MRIIKKPLCNLLLVAFVLACAFNAYGGADPPGAGELPFYGAVDAENKNYITWDGFLTVGLEPVDPTSVSAQVVEGNPDPAVPDHLVRIKFYLTLEPAKGKSVFKAFSGTGVYEGMDGTDYDHVWLFEDSANGKMGLMLKRFLTDKVYAQCTVPGGGFLDGSDPQNLSNVPGFPGGGGTILPTGEPLYASANVVIQTSCDLEQ